MPKLKTSVSFSVSEDIAKRAGLWGLRYLTAEGRVLMSEADLRRVRLEPSEYVHGMDVEEVPEDQVETLIAEGGHRMLPEPDTQEEEIAEEPAGEAVVESAGEEDSENETIEEES